MCAARANQRPIPVALVAERILLGALREQDAAAVARAARERAEFLAAASLRFGASLDEELTYDAIAGVALPGLDAWCIVDVIQVTGTLRRLAVVHPDEDKQLVANMLAERWVPGADDPIGIPAVERARKPVILSHTLAETIAAEARDSETRRILVEFGVGPLLVVPITQREQLLGAITFVARGAFEFSEDDIELAEALALRCAQALESARLYAAARAAWKEAAAASQSADLARAEANAARRTAEAANAAKADFLGKMSHELRTPLNAIGGYAQLLEMGLRGPVTAEQVVDLGRIQRSQVHLLELVDTVLAFARVEAGRVEFAVEAVSLRTVMEELEAFVAPQLQGKSLNYSCDPGPGESVILADDGKVRQILLNLLANAIKFTPPGGSIAVDCCAHAASDDTAGAARVHSICVTDNGCGIASEKLSVIFEPFVQVGRQLNTGSSGVGLGLAISRELARGMGGDLTVTSTPGAGSTFELTLPAA